jgi:hypothetical protein
LFPIVGKQGLGEIGLACAVVIAGSFVFEVWTRVRGTPARETAAWTLVPLLIWTFVAEGRGAPIWTAAVGLASALPVLVFAFWRGGHTRVAAGGTLLAVELPAVIVHASGVDSWNMAAVIFGAELFLGLVCLFLSLWVRIVAKSESVVKSESRWKGAHDLRRVFGGQAWLLLALASIGAVASMEISWRIQERSVSLSVCCGSALVAWLVAAAARWRVESRRRAIETLDLPAPTRDAVPTAAAYALSAYLGAIIERWVAPGNQFAWTALVVLGVGLVWSHLRGPARRLLGCPSLVVEIMWALTSALLAMLVLGKALSASVPPAYVSGAVLTAAGLAWSVDTARFGRSSYLPAASAALTAAAGLFTWSTSSGVAGGLAASGAGAALALAPLALRRKAEWPLFWSLGSAVAAAGGMIAALFAPWSATLALAALAAALAGPSLLGLPACAGPSAFVAFAAICSLEHWTRANAWTGTAVAAVAAAAMLIPAVVRWGRPQPRSGASWSLALAGLLSLAGMLFATILAKAIPSAPAWLSGGDWGIAVLLTVLSAYCAGWSLSARTRWGLFLGAAFLLAGVLTFLHAAKVDIEEAYFTVVAVWCVAFAWPLSRNDRYRRATLALDLVGVIIGLGGPALLMMASGLSKSSTSHATWLICLSVAMVGAGILQRSRLHFGVGLAGAVLAAFWLTSSHLSAIPAVVALVAIVGGALITMGAVGERRRARLTRAAKNAFADWR